jgi:hypothetical protein
MDSILWDDGGSFENSPARVRSALNGILTRRSLESLQASRGDEVHAPLALLFGQPDSPAMKQFMERVDYYDHRSGPFLDIFPVGYTKHKKRRFDAKKFSRTIGEIEQQTKWKYSGGTDILFLCQKVDFKHPEFNLDFSSSVNLCIEECIDRKLILSGSELLERVISLGKDNKGSDLLSALASSIQINGLKVGFMGWLAKLFLVDVSTFYAIGMGAVTKLSR